MNCGIYLIINLVNNKYYVGSSNDCNKRFIQHKSELNRNIHGNRHLQKAWNKYGEHNFKLFIIDFVVENSLEAKEQEWIIKLHACNRDMGYNICAAGRSQKGVKRSEEFKLKNSITHLGSKHLEETKIKIGKSKLGKKRGKRSAEWQAKIVENRKWYKHSKEVKSKMSKAIQQGWEKRKAKLDEQQTRI